MRVSFSRVCQQSEIYEWRTMECGFSLRSCEVDATPAGRELNLQLWPEPRIVAEHLS
jgi:hypothetical protein